VSAADLGKFSLSFAEFRKLLAAVPQEARTSIFNEAATEAASYVSQGLDRALAADELADIAIAYGLDDPDEVTWIISQAFEQIERVPKPEPETNGHDKHSPKVRQPLFPYEPQPFKDIAPRQWLHARHYVRRHVVMTVAPGGYGKSSLLLANAIEMVIGRGLIGPQPLERVRVCYWNAEEPEAEEIYRRIAALCLAHSINPEDLRGELFLGPKISTDEWRFARVDRYGKIIRNEDLIKLVTEYVADNHIACLMLDPMVQFHHLPEIDTMCMEYLVKDIMQPIAISTNCCIEFSHHTRKGGQGFNGEITADDGRGAGAAVAASRSARVLNRMSKEEAQSAKIDEEQRKLYLRVQRDKTNMAPPTKARWIRLTSVDIGNGDHVQAAIAWKFPQPFDDVTVEDIHFMREQVRRQSYLSSPRSPNWVGYALMEHLGFDKDNRGDRGRTSAILKMWFENGALAVETRKDEARRDKEFVIPGTWRDEEAEALQPSLI
jgi:AAA domain